MQNQQKIGELADDVRRLQVANKELDSNLSTITSYQQELKTSLEVRTFDQSDLSDTGLKITR